MTCTLRLFYLSTDRGDRTKENVLVRQRKDQDSWNWGLASLLNVSWKWMFWNRKHVDVTFKLSKMWSNLVPEKNKLSPTANSGSQWKHYSLSLHPQSMLGTVVTNTKHWYFFFSCCALMCYSSLQRNNIHMVPSDKVLRSLTGCLRSFQCSLNKCDGALILQNCQFPQTFT